MAMITTLNRIRSFHPCMKGWGKLLKHLGKTQADDEPLNLSVVLESNDLLDAIWCMRALEDLSVCGEFAKMCADSVAHLDNRLSKCAYQYAAYAADDAADAAYAATYATYATYAAAAAAYATAYAAAYAATYAADAAAAAAAAASNAERNKQKEFFLSLCN